VVVTHGARAVHGALVTGGRIHQPKDDRISAWSSNRTRRERTTGRDSSGGRRACASRTNGRMRYGDII